VCFQKHNFSIFSSYCFTRSVTNLWHRFLWLLRIVWTGKLLLKELSLIPEHAFFRSWRQIPHQPPIRPDLFSKPAFTWWSDQDHIPTRTHHLSICPESPESGVH
jgi:hypothetical protein